MNILILTAKFGLGHYKAAESVKERIMMNSDINEVFIVDFFDYVFPDLSKTIYATFNMLVNKCPKIYNILNMLSPKNNPVPFKNVAVNKINDLIYDNKIDKIISVVPICSEYISAYINATGSNVELNTLITDIEVHESWINENTFRYFVPSLETKRYLIGKGIDEERVIISGIPVNSSFNVSTVVNHKKKILIMGGGLGLIPKIDYFLDFINDNLNVDVTIILGSNQKLYNKLSRKYNNINVIGYTSEVYKYMKEADLLITKSGGITLFEAIETETPMLIIKPFLVQEIGNAKFVENNNIGKVMWNEKNIYNFVLNLLNNNSELDVMRKNMHDLKSSISDYNFVSIFSLVGDVC